MKTFLSAAAVQLSRAHLTNLASIPALLTAGLILSPVGLNTIRSGRQVFIEWWSGQSHHGHVSGAERVSGALGAPFPWCRHGDGCGGM